MRRIFGWKRSSKIFQKFLSKIVVDELLGVDNNLYNVFIIYDYFMSIDNNGNSAWTLKTQPSPLNYWTIIERMII